MSVSFEPKKQPQDSHASGRESQSAVTYPSQIFVHAKLEMTDPGDADEREADAVADELMSGGKISRKISEGGGAGAGIAVPRQMESRLEQLRGGGMSMPSALRSQMEGGFGHGFPNVRLHTDSEAARLSESIGARAFTHGSDIFFNHGQYAPDTVDGQRLVAHELAHVVQGGRRVAREELVLNSVESRNNYAELYELMWTGSLSESDKALCNEKRYKETDFYKKINSLFYSDFYRLLCIHAYEFQSIGYDYPGLLIAIYNRHKEAFISLRFASYDLLCDIFTRSPKGFDKKAYSSIYNDPELRMKDKATNELLNYRDEDKEALLTPEYHDTLDQIGILLYNKKYEEAAELLTIPNTYDFCELLKREGRMPQLMDAISEESYERLFSSQIHALAYLYETDKRTFDKLFLPKLEFLNLAIARPLGYHFLHPTMRLILDKKTKLKAVCDGLIAAIYKYHEIDYRWDYEELGNEDLDLFHVHDIVSKAKKNLGNITEYSNLEQSVALYTEIEAIVAAAALRLDYYRINLQNGVEQRELLDAFTAAVIVSVATAATGGIAGVLGAGAIVSAGVATATSIAVQSFVDVFQDKNLGLDVLQSGALGAIGDVASAQIAKRILSRIPGPAGKAVLDIIVGVALSMGADALSRGSLLTSEKHDDELDFVLYGYFMAQLGGIDYDESKKLYYLKRPLIAKDYERRKEVVAKLNELMIKTGRRPADS